VAEVADLVLSHLWADENTGTPWESASGAPPKVMWYPPPCSGRIGRPSGGRQRFSHSHPVAGRPRTLRGLRP
jgi:hypothetical protein